MLAMNTSHSGAVVAGSLICLASVATVSAQIPGVDLFQDSESASICDLVNSANAHLVVLTDTGEFALVTGEDTRLEGTFVDVNGDVFVNDEPAGFVTFADDGDGLRSLWWLAPSGFAVHIDTITLQISESQILPDQISDVPCDACTFWDVAADCQSTEPPPDERPVVINFCGSGIAMMGLPMMLGLHGLRARRRHERR